MSLRFHRAGVLVRCGASTMESADGACLVNEEPEVHSTIGRPATDGFTQERGCHSDILDSQSAATSDPHRANSPQG